ncbi:hypothetical protein RJ641_022604 [Dillenia turbinata]|uniref:Uncharacterized protein n=1 Tax=Dillenia turbinata TaxID=194707 RepID=A0AAN8ULX2_9MAGN
MINEERGGKRKLTRNRDNQENVWKGQVGEEGKAHKGRGSEVDLLIVSGDCEGLLSLLHRLTNPVFELPMLPMFRFHFPDDVYVVVLFYKEGFRYAECGLMLQCLEELATRHPATKFVKIISTDCIPNYLDRNLPTLLVYNNGAVKAN